MAQRIVFIHGAWLTPASWTDFKAEFEAKGYETLAPAWPYLDRPIADLRANPTPELAKLGIAEIVAHYAATIKALDEPPILIGHSFGGLITQLLLDQGLGVAGVAIDPAPPRGVIPGLITIRSGWPVLSKINGWNKVHTISEAAFNSTFGNALTPAQQTTAYADFVVPAPGKIFFQAAFGIANKITWKNPERAPLLLTAGGVDRTVEPAMAKRNYQKQAQAPSTTTFLELPGMCHFLMIQDGWKAVTVRILEWLSVNAPGKN